ncbi:MAG: hypothetical protein K2X93_09990 [Candidatus Obscuribacterales bacterium]|nr:hypothetical protein [Candidatus Obscuribacterales bacterium]
MSDPVLKREQSTGTEATLEAIKTAFRGIHKPVAIMDSEFKVAFVNKTWARLTAVTEDECVGKTLDLIVHPKDIPGITQAFESLEAQGTRVKARVRSGRDNYEWCSMEVANLEVNGDLYRVLLSTEREFLHIEFTSAEAGLKKIAAQLWANGDLPDELGDQDELTILKSRLDTLSQKVATEKELRINSEKLAHALLGQFAWLLAHELKEPVRVIATTTGLLLNDCNDEDDRRELTSYLREAASTATQKIDDILYYCSIDRNQWTLKKVDLQKVVAKIIEDTKSKHKKKNATVTIDSAPLPKIVGHKSSLELIFEQLLTNALLYCGDREPVIDVSAYENNGDEWVFAVKDNGIGIAEGSHKRVFDMFCRLDRNVPGRGIGLPISKRIAELHDGRMWLESQIGEGSTFYFSISKKVTGVPTENA